MDAIIDKRFERVEKALATLINSISTYNPAPALANDLVTADEELSRGLEQLSTHQSNYAKIVALRATSQELDSQIKETLLLLTSTRTALLSTPASTFPTTTNPISYSELLSYARRISKFTLPSSYRETEAQSNVESGEATSINTPKESKSESQTNGTTTPNTATNGVERDMQLTASTTVDIDNGNPVGSAQQTSQVTNTSSNISLPVDISQWLNPPADMFIPWPTEETIRRGALASIQLLVDKNIDPASYDPEKTKELEEETKRLADHEDMLREEERTRLEDERRREMERRMSVSGSLAGEKREEVKPSAFQLETFDDDDDD